jgi:hypothetical protein
VLYDFSVSAKGSLRAELQRIFQISDANVIAAPDASAPYPYRVVLGSDFDSCVKPQRIVRATPTPGAPTAVTEQNIIHAFHVTEANYHPDNSFGEWPGLFYAIREPNFNPQNWKNPDDTSASWNAAWDDKYLYLAISVKDDAFVQETTGDQLYKGDSVEVWLNINLGENAKTLTPFDFQLGISPGNLHADPFKQEAYRWLPRDTPTPVLDAATTARIVPGGYEVEVAIPWTVFRLIPISGQSVGFVLAVNDNDTPNAPAQETQLTNVKNAKLIDPSTWGILVLDP